jgi:DNA helicase-2/ATP-dependent DNA helicase PcrA
MSSPNKAAYAAYPYFIFIIIRTLVYVNKNGAKLSVLSGKMLNACAMDKESDIRYNNIERKSPENGVDAVEIEQLLEQKGVRLTAQQKQGLHLDGRPMLLLAVPGSGKTTVLVSRIAAQLYAGIPAGQILNLTFSRESARDMARRFGALFPELPPPRFSTIHSLCYSVLRAYADENGRIVPTLTGSNGAPSSNQLLREIVRQKNRGFVEEEDLADALNCIGLIKNRMLTGSEIGDISCAIEGLPELYAQYQAVKSEKGLMDYDDILLYALTFLQKIPGLLQHFRQRYPYINVDESQDISKVQLEIIKLLSPDGKNLFMVGDEDQSIYGFRGAYPEGILSFEKDFPGAVVARMEDNFRSRPELLSLCEGFIRLNRQRYDKRLRAGRASLPGAVIPFKPSVPEKAMERILTAVSSLKEGETLGILYRNNLSAFPAADLLQMAGIPFWVTASPVTLIRYHIKVACDLLQMADQPFNRELFASMSCLDLSKEVRAQLLRIFDGTRSFPELLLLCADEKANRLGAVLRDIRGLPPEDSMRRIEKELKTGKFLLAKALSTDDPRAALRSSIFRQFCRRTGSTDELLQRIRALESFLREPALPEKPSVYLSTIHSAKGLEFDHVLLLDCCEGILPGQTALQKVGSKAANDAYYEEVRLFYVAATRARETLTLFYPAASDKGLLPSRFLQAFLHPEPVSAPTTGTSLDLRPGDLVSHAKLGAGQVVRIEGDNATIAFKVGPITRHKTLSLSYCAAHGMLKKAP